jgi:Cdc6-like AAA superfamily ATPase
MKSPNLKLDCILREPGLPLLTFRKNEIKAIRDNIVSFLEVTKMNNIKNKYKKILLVVGNSGTGKSSSIGLVLDEISGYVKNNINRFVNLSALRIIYLNANLIFNCEKI